MFRKNRKLKQQYDARLHQLLVETKDEWNHARSIENLADSYDVEVQVQRKIAESKHFYLYREVKIRKL